ncbi:hypothetical protein CMI37_05435 [Candidatus Pacearchaeota archaeon]|nr:hypothetical protein [Candidatus Pacearchaeota archaeon]|tara:strand:- start:103 stop:705 length:603 start_codon:yes stop_codon:yes gene_type:complete
MGIISKLNCEHPLPIPWSDFSEEERDRFEKVKWDELDFYTTSFYDIDEGDLEFSTYTISEDGQFYKNKKEIKFTQKEGEYDIEEIDAGIELQEFTGEIYFSAEFYEEKRDHVVTFKSLFFKGDLKELELESWDKKNNEERKKTQAKIVKKAKETLSQKKSLKHLILWPFKEIIYLMVSAIKWIMFKVFALCVYLERWSRE